MNVALKHALIRKIKLTKIKQLLSKYFSISILMTQEKPIALAEIS